MKKTVLSLVLVLFVSAATLQSCSTANLLGSGSSLLSSLGGSPNLSTFTSLLKTPGLDKLIGPSLKGPFTMLAPSNSALSSLGADAIGNLTKPENLNQLAGVLNKHIVPGKLDASSLLKGGLKSAGGNNLDLGGINMGDAISGKNFNIIPVDKLIK
ncbi:MAG: fasciclin domain-containing protein [Ferruginibacter sp.]